MNLANLIDPEWAQGGFRPRAEPVAPAWYVPPPKNAELRRVDMLGVADAAEALRVAQEAKVRRELAAAVAAAAAAPRPRYSVKRTRPESDKVSADNPWPRGRKGARFWVLAGLGKRADRALTAQECRAFSRPDGSPVDINIVCAVLSKLLRHKLVERSGSHTSYRYRITAAGLKAVS